MTDSSGTGSLFADARREFSDAAQKAHIEMVEAMRISHPEGAAQARGRYHAFHDAILILYKLERS